MILEPCLLEVQNDVYVNINNVAEVTITPFNEMKESDARELYTISFLYATGYQNNYTVDNYEIERIRNALDRLDF